MLAIILALITFVLLKDTPQSCGLPPIEEWKNDYPERSSQTESGRMSGKEIFYKYILRNKYLWYLAIANIFVYFIRYGVVSWAPTYLTAVKGFTKEGSRWAYFLYEWAGIPGMLVSGYLSDKVFRGRRAPATMIFMVFVVLAILVYWFNPAGNILVDNLALIAIGFLIYGPVMMIGLQAADMVPREATGGATGLTGLTGYLIGSAFAGAAGVLVGIYYNSIDPLMGIMPGLKAFVAAVFGGIGSIPGAMIGGLSIGILETLVSGYGNSMYRDAAVFAFLILILILRPSGLLGKNTREKV